MWRRIPNFTQISIGVKRCFTTNQLTLRHVIIRQEQVMHKKKSCFEVKKPFEMTSCFSTVALSDEIHSLHERLNFLSNSFSNDTKNYVQNAIVNITKSNYDMVLMDIHRAMFSSLNGVQMSQLYHWSSRFLLAFSNTQKNNYFKFTQWSPNTENDEKENNIFGDDFVSITCCCRLLIGIGGDGDIVHQILDNAIIQLRKQQTYYSKAIDNAMALFFLMKGMMFNDSGMNREADKMLDTAIKLLPDFVLAYIIRGISLCSNGEMKKGLSYLDRAIELDQTNPMSWMQRAPYLLTEDMQRAFLDINRAIELEPDNPTLYLIRGNMISVDASSVDKALEDYSHSISLNPNIPNGYFARANIFFRYEEFQQNAIDELNKVLEIENNFASAYNLLALIEEKRKNYQAALQNINKVIKIDENYPLIYELKGKIYLEGLNDVTSATQCFQEAINKRSFTLDTLIRMSKYHMEKKECDKAYDLLTDAIQMEPNIPQSYILRGELNLNIFNDYQSAIQDFDQGIEKSNAQNIQIDSKVLIDRAFALLSIKDSVKAIAQLKEILKMSNLPERNRQLCWILIAQGYYQVEKANECMQALDQASLIDDQNPLIYYNRALVLRNILHKVQDSIAALSQAIHLSSNSDLSKSNYYFERGISYTILPLSQHNNELALQDFNLAISMNPQFRRAIIARCHLLMNMKRYAQALSDIDDIISSYTTSEETSITDAELASYYTLRGNLRCMLGKDLKKAKEDIDKALEIEPENYLTLLARARLYLEELNDIRKGMRDLNYAIFLNDKFFDAYLYRCNYYRTMVKDFNNAVKDADICIKLNPTSASVYNERALIFMILRKYDLAMQDLHQSASLETTAEVFAIKSLVQMHLHQYELAISDCNRAIELNPSFLESYNLMIAIECEQGLIKQALEHIKERLQNKDVISNENMQIVPRIIRLYIHKLLLNINQESPPEVAEDFNWLQQRGHLDKYETTIKPGSHLASLFDNTF